MASRSLGQLTIDLIARVGGFVDGMDRAERSTERFRRAATEKLAAVGKAAGALAAGAAVAGTAMVVNAASAAKEVKNLSSVANASTTEFQRWSVGAQTVGIEQQKLADIFKDMSDRVGDFLSTGGGPMKDFFENVAPQIGITADQFRRLSGPEALQLYVSSLEKANLSQNEMAFYMEAVASDATALLPLLKNNGAELERLGDHAERVGVVLSEMEIQQLAEVRQGLDDLGLVFEGLGNKVAVAALPYINEFSTLMQDPATIEGIQDIANGLISIATAAVDAAAGISSFSRWVGESLAAAIHGPAFDDLARLNDELDRLTRDRAQLDAVARMANRDPNSDPRIVALDKEIEKTKELIAQQQNRIAQAAQLARVNGLMVPPEMLRRVDSLNKSYGLTGQQIAGLVVGQKDLKRAADPALEKASQDAERYKDQIQAILDKLYPQQAAVRDLTHEYRLLAQAVGFGMADQSSLHDWIDANVMIKTTTREAAVAVDDLADKADPLAESWQAALERIDNAFVELWKSAFDGFDDFADALKDAFIQLLAELAHRATTQKILVSLGLDYGQGGPAQGGGDAAGSDLSSLSSLSSLSNFSSILTTGLATLGSTLTQVLPSAMSQGLMQSGYSIMSDAAFEAAVMQGGLEQGWNMATGAGALWTAGAGIVGGYGGTKLGENIFGKEAESAWGASAGAAAGAYIGSIVPVLGTALGALIGGAIGGLVDVASGGDGKTRAAIGVSTNAGWDNIDTMQGASGLALTAYSKRAGGEGWEAAKQMQQVLLATDAALTGFFTSLGVTVDLAGQTLAGKASQFGSAADGFFGAAGFNGLDPQELVGATDEFVRAWVARVNDLTGAALDLDPLFALKNEGEALADTLIRVTTEFDVVNTVMRELNRDVYDLSISGIAASSALVAANGGLDVFLQKANQMVGLSSVADQLRMGELGGLSRRERFNALQSEFAGLQLAAEGGDLGAYQELGRVAQEYARSIREIYATGETGNRLFQEVLATLDNLSSFDTGTAMVSRTGLAQIHYGEKIIDPQSSRILSEYGIRVTGDPAVGEETKALRAEVAKLTTEVILLRRQQAEIGAAQLAEQRKAAEAATTAARAAKQKTSTTFTR